MLEDMFLIILMIGCCILMVTGKQNIEIIDNKIKIKSIYWPTVYIDINDIKEIDTLYNLNAGIRVFGLGNFKIASGKFYNKEFGIYRLYCSVKDFEFLKLSMRDGQIIVLGLNQGNFEIKNIIENSKQE